MLESSIFQETVIFEQISKCTKLSLQHYKMYCQKVASTPNLVIKNFYFIRCLPSISDTTNI